MTPSLPCPFALERLLVCNDDSPASQGALRAALDLAQACGARIVLLYALEFFPFFDYSQPDALGLPPAAGQELYELRERTAREHLEEWRGQAAQPGGGGGHPHPPGDPGLHPDPGRGRRSPTGSHHHGPPGRQRPRAPPGGQRHRPGHRPYPGQSPGGPPGRGPVLYAAVGGHRRLPGQPDGRREPPWRSPNQTQGHLTAVTVTHSDLDPKRAKALVKELGGPGPDPGP
jgi:hypothetical protein